LIANNIVFSLSLYARADRLTSVIIPVGFACVAAGTAVKSLYGMYTGTSKMD
jgi:hypothetical protein